jgi:hypothetical protein
MQKCEEGRGGREMLKHRRRIDVDRISKQCSRDRMSTQNGHEDQRGAQGRVPGACLARALGTRLRARAWCVPGACPARAALWMKAKTWSDEVAPGETLVELDAANPMVCLSWRKNPCVHALPISSMGSTLQRQCTQG